MIPALRSLPGSMCYSDIIYADKYLRSPSRLCHSVPCDNKQCGWSEVSRGWKQLLQLITGSFKKGGIRCLPVEYVSKSPNVHIIPERSHQWNIRERKHLGWISKSWLECNNSVMVYLWTRIIERSNLVTTQIFESKQIIIIHNIFKRNYKISYCIIICTSDNTHLNK